MPTYDYVCEKCGERTEIFQSITAKPLKKCPSCGRMSLRRLIGAGAGVLFKGSGFYQTDYRSESYKQATRTETDSGTSKTSAEKKTESSDSKGKKNPAAAQPGE